MEAITAANTGSFANAAAAQMLPGFFTRRHWVDSASLHSEIDLMNPKLRILIMASVALGGTVLVGACGGADDGMPCVSPSIPDGGADEGTAARWLAFDSDRGTFNRDIYLVRDDGAQLMRLTTEPSFEKEPAFSHNGKILAFASDRSGTMQIYAMDLAKGGVTQLTSRDAGADQPSWSGDDSRILFHSGPSVYVMAADGSHPEVLATGLMTSMRTSTHRSRWTAKK